jgi:hypothetical protein
LERVVEALRSRFSDAGYTVPEKIRVSIGWPKRSVTCAALGECWSTSASSDRHAELFISPELTDGLRIVGVLVHELVHATVGVAAGHGPLFKRCALAIGLRGPMRATEPGEDFIAWAEALFRKVGDYPSGFLSYAPAQSTRMLRCECQACGYIARVSRRWLDEAGPPICPTDKIPMRMG